MDNAFPVELYEPYNVKSELREIQIRLKFVGNC